MEPKRVKAKVHTFSSATNSFARSEDGIFPLADGYLTIVQCGGCNEDFVVFRGRAVWPLSVPPTPEGVPPKVAEAYKDARTALAAGAPIAAVMSARTTLYRMLHEQKVSQFKELVPDVLTKTLYGGADQVRGWADVAGHGDIDVDEFKPAELDVLLDYMATVLEAVYTQPAKVAGFAQRTRELEGKAPPPSKVAKPPRRDPSR